jgi:hypothetical protein
MVRSFEKGFSQEICKFTIEFVEFICGFYIFNNGFIYKRDGIIKE